MKRSGEGHYQPIENYGVIGDLRTVALVGMDGSIDFLCFPEFDSPSIFAALLDSQKGGFFKIAPLEENVTRRQMYLPDSNILVTRFLMQNGIGEIIDFMPVADLSKDNILIRKVINIRGRITYRMHCCPRFNYGSNQHKAARTVDSIIFTCDGADGLCIRLKSTVPLSIKHGDGFAEFTLNPNESAGFYLERINKEDSPGINDCEEFIEHLFSQTLMYWKKWSARCTYNGRWREMVVRSALVLKLLISSKHGAILAAPTFSLPEYVGREKNWDYRFTWIRDAAFTVYSLMRIGYTYEADMFMKWIQMLCDGMKPSETLQVMYGIDGRKNLSEKILHHFEGYKGSAPVRIGNEAYTQLQMDIYGELMDSIYLYDKYVGQISHDTWKFLIKQIDWVAKNWKAKDHGIWEIRGRQREFLYSRFMCWVAIDRGIRLGQKRSLPFPDTWLKERDKIYNSVFQDFWNHKCNAFVQYKGAKGVDASALLMPLMRFISPKDPRWLSTLKLIEEELVMDSLVYRNKSERHDQNVEGSFTACSFWYTECLSRSGELRKALLCFEKILGYANHLGLYSEELGFQGEHLGNFPQAFTHLALISAAFDLDRRLNEKPEYWG